MRRIVILTGLLLAAFASLSLAAAQGVVTLTYGSASVGTLSEAAPAALYVFTGSAGDLVTVQVRGITPGMSPTVTLLGSAQQAMGNDDFDPFDLSGRSARVTARLTQPGAYSVLVSGTPGEFLISLDSRTSAPQPLLPGTPTQVGFASGAGIQYFSFNTDPSAQTSLQIVSLNGSDFRFDLFDGSGRLVTVVDGGVLSVCYSLPSGGSLYEMSIVPGSPAADGQYSVGLVSGACAAAALSPAETPEVDANLPPAQLPGLCTASSQTNTNIRSGPGTEFSVIGTLAAGEGIEVTGQTSNGWYAVRRANLQGYVAMDVVRVAGPCAGLPVTQVEGQTPQPPVQTEEAQPPTATSDGLPTATYTATWTLSDNPTPTYTATWTPTWTWTPPPDEEPPTATWTWTPEPDGEAPTPTWTTAP
jgi:uncharacterized protein YraI